MRISTSYPLFIVSLALLAALVTGVVAYRGSVEELRRAADDKLVSLREARVAALDAYLDSIRQDLRVVATSVVVRDALPAFVEAWEALGPDPTALLQRLYIDENPHPTGQKERLDDPGDGSRYSAAHRRFHLRLRNFLRERGYYDIFLFSPAGDLVYTVFKERDYATNLDDGPWRDTGLGRAFRAARDAARPEFQAFVEFAPYEPSHGAPASFIATAAFDRSGRMIGVLAFQMPIGRINEIMQVSAGMGESGETYIVGPDLLMRSDSRFSEESTILRTRVDTDTVHRALAGETGVAPTPDYRGIPVLSAYGPLEFLGTTWAIMAEVDEAEVLAGVRDMRRYMLFTGAAIALLVTAAGVFLSLRLSRPITAMTRVMDQLAEGDVEIEIPSQGRRDEIGEMAAAVRVFEERTRLLRREIKMRTEAESSARQMQEDLMPRPELVRKFEDRHGLAIVSHFEPSFTLSGDFWGMANLGDTKLGVYLVDFSGHGVNAALNTFRLHTLIEQLGPIPDDPSSYLRTLNGYLSRLLSQGNYATMLCGIIDTAADRFSYAAAAATHPLVFLPDGELIVGESSGLPLGIMQDAAHEIREAPFPKGSVLFLYSDALIEIPDSNGIRMGDEGLVDRVSDHLRKHGPEDLLVTIIEGFMASIDAPLADDLTALSLWRKV